jgi:hypothetical protein
LQLIGVLLLAASASCRHTPAPSTSAATQYPAPSPEDGGRVCSDVGGERVCWRGDKAELVARTLPGGATPPHGYRCGGAGRERVCEDRSRNGSAFTCGTQRCLQERPRMPDDGEWECVEISGVVFCHSRGAVAGMQTGPIDLGWSCGPRRGADEGERICVDLDPDRPDGGADRHCRFEPHFGAPQRSCTAARTLLVGDACQNSQACPAGSRCEVGLCLPARPEPACWLDRDCGAGARCVFGSCAKAGA